jgi:phosphoglycerate dehydrogenase-like enzyme
MTQILLLMPDSHRESVFTAEMLERLGRCGTVHVAPTATDHRRADVRALLATADVVVTGTGTAKLDRDVLAAAPHVRAIVHAAGTLRPIVDEDVYDRGIELSSQAPTNALPVAEYTLAMILLELKGVPAVGRTYRAARGQVDVDALLAAQGVYGRRVGVVSASSIGRRVIALLQPFDVDVVVFDPFLDPDEARRLGATSVDLDTLLRTSDLVTVHAPLLPSTVGMIGATELAAMGKGTVLVNTARGALIDEEALIAELRTGRIRAVVDVTDPEVPAPDSPLWDLENLVLTPHVAGSRGRELQRIGAEVVGEVERVVRGEPLRFGVPRARYATSA